MFKLKNIKCKPFNEQVVDTTAEHINSYGEQIIIIFYSAAMVDNMIDIKWKEERYRDCNEYLCPQCK